MPDLFSTPEGSLGAAIAALLLVLGYRFARPDSAREWLGFVGYAWALVATFLAGRGVLPGGAVEAGPALRWLGAAVLVLGLVLAGSAVRARRISTANVAGSDPATRARRTAWLGLALVLIGFVARTPSVTGAVAVLGAVLLAGWAALQRPVVAPPRT